MSQPRNIEDLLAHADWLRGLASHIVRGSQDADEIVQETWAAAVRTPPHADRPPRPWLATVLRNFARRRARSERTRLGYETEAADPVAEAPSPEVLLERAEAQRLLAALVVALPEPYRSTVLLRYYEGLTSTAIAKAQNVPPGTVRWRLNEALQRLRAGLEDRYGRDRKTWGAVLAPLVRAASSGPSLQGALLMISKTKLAAAGVALALLALVGGAIVWRADGPPGQGVALPEAAARARTPAPLARSREVLTAWTRAPGGRSGTIAGRVLDADGQHAPGAQVALVVAAAYEEIEDKAALRPHATAVSGAHGAFRFLDVPPGLYLLTATADGWSPAERSGLSLLPGESQSGIELKLARGGIRLAGRISDAGGGPLGGAAVRILALGAGGRPDGARTFVGTARSDGRYEVRLARGSYRMVADAEGYAPETLDVRLDLDQTRDFRLTAAARISGRVVERGGSAVARATIRLDAEGFLASDRRTGSSKDDGSFAFQNVPAGSYRLSARAGMLTGRTPRRVVLASGGSATDVLLELERGLAISGKVHDAAGRPVAGARVRLDGDQQIATAAADGAYRIEGLLPGKHALLAEATGHGGARVSVLTEKTDVQRIDFILAKEGRVSGTVRDRRGVALPGASVTALVVVDDAASESVTSSAVGRSDERGRFDLGGLGSGELRIEAEHPTDTATQAAKLGASCFVAQRA